MNEKRDDTRPETETRSTLQKLLDLLLKTGAIFILLEPIWMLLPFAGFIYGSVMHIQWLSRNPLTAWLVHFVLPTHTLFPLGIILILLGLTVFLVGAFQIYSAKLFKKGLVTGGIYGKFRHPQYLSLTLFGIGILLTWGRFITYIAFFVMMWLYYYLSKSEERKCRALFGSSYEQYRRDTWFLFPGEDKLCAILPGSHNLERWKWIYPIASFVLVVGLSIGSGFLIQKIKREVRPHPPMIQGDIQLSAESSDSVTLAMVKGPALQAAPFHNRRNQFMGKVFKMLVSSQKIKQAMQQTGLNERHAVVAFVTPGANWHKGAHHDQQAAAINAYMVVTAPDPAPDPTGIFKNNHKIPILKVIKAESLNYGRLAEGRDPTEGEVTVLGPPLGRKNAVFTKSTQERIHFFSSGL